MNIIINGVEPQFKVYKMTDSVESKFYVGKTKKSLKERMNGHKHGDHGEKSADSHFADVGWRNVTVEIIDTVNDEQELALKEREHIIKNKGPLMLNKHFFSTAHIWGNLEKINAKKYLARVWSEDCNSWIIKMIET